MKRILFILTVATSLAIAAIGTARAQDEAELPGFDEEAADAMFAEVGDPGPMAEFAHRGPMERGHGRAKGTPRGMGGMMGREGALLWGGGRLAEELDLTGTQRDKLRTIGDGLARKRIRLRADLDLARLDLRAAMGSDSPSLSQLGTRIDAVTRIQGEMMKAGVSARLDARKVLTAEQLEKLLEMRPARVKGAPGRRGSSGSAH